MLEDEEGRDALRALGARSVPVVARGKAFVHAQVLADVVGFLGLEEDTAPVLSPEALVRRCERILLSAVALCRQMPDGALERTLPERPRTWRVLMHHVFQIPRAFLDAERSGRPLTYESLVAPPPETLATSEAIARFGEEVRSDLLRWWTDGPKGAFRDPVATYFGETTRHELLERTVWHCAQHVRQLASLLETIGIEPVAAPGPELLRGLPLTERIWDEAP